MIVKKLFLTYLLLAVSGGCFSLDMSGVLKSMPDSVLPLLTLNNRLDCIDYLNSGMKAVVVNRLAGKSEMTVLTEDYACIANSQVSKVDMKLLPYNDDVVIAVVNSVTIDNKYTDSDIFFYSSDWKRLDGTLFSLDTDPDTFYEYQFSPSNTNLTIKVTEPLKLDDPKTSHETVMRWENGRFVR